MALKQKMPRGPQGGPRVAVLGTLGLLLFYLAFLGGPSGALPLPSPSALGGPRTLLPPRIPMGSLGLRGLHPSEGLPRVLGALRGGGLFGAPDPKKEPSGGATGDPSPSLKAPNLLTVGPPHTYDVAAVYIHPKRARELHLQPGIPLELKGRRKRKTAGVLIEDSTLKEDEVSVHPRVCRHLKLFEGDLLLIDELRTLIPASRVYVQVFKDCLPSLGGPPGAPTAGEGGGPRGAPMVGEEIERAVDAFFRARARPVRVGDQYTIPLSLITNAKDERQRKRQIQEDRRDQEHPREEEIEVKVMRIDGDAKGDIEFGLVADGTEILTGEETIDRGKEK